MAQSEQTTETASVPPKKGGSKVVIIMGVAVLALAGACGYLLLGHGAHDKAAAKEPKVEMSKQEQYLAMDPPFVVNFQSDTAARFLQVGVQLMAHDQKALDAAKASEPAVRNALVMLFSSQDAKTLVSRDGKEKLRSDALDEIRKIVAERTQGATLDAVYFTSFVMQ